VKLLLVTLIVLPVLPNQNYTQFNLNPAHIWQIVILVSSIGFVGYFLSKQFGGKIGLWLSGVLGGIVSSTATSVAVGRIAQRDPEQSESALQASILASSVMYLRILIIILVITPVIGVLIAWKLKPALIFGVLFVLLTIITELVVQYLGNAGLMGLSAVVGVSDIDPFVLSLVRRADLSHSLIIIALLIAMMSNTLTKGAYFSTLAKSVRKETWLRYGIWALLHLPLILLA
jgi:uncharacterized membrane protein (DUF4010 family)